MVENQDQQYWRKADCHAAFALPGAEFCRGGDADFRDLDWKPVAVAIARLEAYKRQLEAASDLLKALTAQLTALENELRETEGQFKERNDKHSKAERKISDARDLQHQAPVLLAETAYPRRLACGAAAQQAKKPA